MPARPVALALLGTLFVAPHAVAQTADTALVAYARAVYVAEERNGHLPPSESNYMSTGAAYSRWASALEAIAPPQRYEKLHRELVRQARAVVRAGNSMRAVPSSGIDACHDARGVHCPAANTAVPGGARAQAATAVRQYMSARTSLQQRLEGDGVTLLDYPGSYFDQKGAPGI
jgi:hypothetical protein